MRALREQKPSQRKRSFAPSPRIVVQVVVAVAVLVAIVVVTSRYLTGRGTVKAPEPDVVLLRIGENQPVLVEVKNGKVGIATGPAALAQAPGDRIELSLGHADLIRIVDALGGILVHIPERIEYKGTDGLPVRIDAGRRRLDGDAVAVYLQRPNAAPARSLTAVALGVTTRVAELLAGGNDIAAIMTAVIGAEKDQGDRSKTVRIASLLANASTAGPADIVVKWNEYSPPAATVAPGIVTPAPPVPELAVLRVRILNGDGRPGLAARAAAALLPPRFLVAETTNADRFGYDQTLVRASSDRYAREVMAALGIGRFEYGSSLSGADVEVVLGKDARKKWM